MAADMFIDIKGVKGEAQDAKHKDEIDVLAWSFGASQSGTTHMGSGSGGGKVSFQDLSFTKYVDKSTPDLIKACANGKHFGEATLTVRKAGEKPLEYIIFKMKDVIVSSYSTGGSGGEDRLTENVTLNFAEIDYKYTEQLKDGGQGAQPEFKWKIPENEEG